MACFTCKFVARRKHFSNELQAVFSGRGFGFGMVMTFVICFSALAGKRHCAHGKICAVGPAAQCDFSHFFYDLNATFFRMLEIAKTTILTRWGVSLLWILYWWAWPTRVCSTKKKDSCICWL
jgi:hypothetical protein